MEQKIKAIKKIISTWENKNKTVQVFPYLENISHQLNATLRKYTERGKNGFKTVIKVLEVEGSSVNTSKQFSLNAASFECIKRVLDKLQIPIDSVVRLEESWLKTQSEGSTDTEKNIFCPICDQSIKFSDTNEHIRVCHEAKLNSYRIKCKKCCKNVPMTSWSSHWDKCWMTICYVCSEEVKTQDFQKHALECWNRNKEIKKKPYNLRNQKTSQVPLVVLDSDSSDSDSAENAEFHCAACLQPIKST